MLIISSVKIARNRNENSKDSSPFTLNLTLAVVVFVHEKCEDDRDGKAEEERNIKHDKYWNEWREKEDKHLTSKFH
jgi:hypothetical protein